MIYAVFFGIPALSVFFFVFSLISYCTGRSKEKNAPGSIGAEELRRRKIWMIVTGIIALVIVAAVVLFIITLMNAIAHM